MLSCVCGRYGFRMGAGMWAVEWGSGNGVVTVVVGYGCSPLEIFGGRTDVSRLKNFVMRSDLCCRLCFELRVCLVGWVSNSSGRVLSGVSLPDVELLVSLVNPGNFQIGGTLRVAVFFARFTLCLMASV